MYEVLEAMMNFSIVSLLIDIMKKIYEESRDDGNVQ